MHLQPRKPPPSIVSDHRVSCVHTSACQSARPRQGNLERSLALMDDDDDVRTTTPWHQAEPTYVVKGRGQGRCRVAVDRKAPWLQRERDGLARGPCLASTFWPGIGSTASRPGNARTRWCNPVVASHRHRGGYRTLVCAAALTSRALGASAVRPCQQISKCTIMPTWLYNILKALESN